MDGELFGKTAADEDVRRFHIAAGGLTATVMQWGAVLQDLRLEGHDAPLVLGFDTFDAYLSYSPFFGAVAGRYANRISHGRFVVDGQHYQADLNFLGKHTLHGGVRSTATRVWKLSALGPDFVTLALRDPDGEMGFPGNLDIFCTYRLKLPGILSIELTATTDQPTLCNLTNHSYFNLDDGGHSNVLDHRLTISAGAYLPVDDEMIPSGEVRPVDGTAFDFRLGRPIRWEEGERQVLYDHNFCLSSQRGQLRHVAWAQGASSGTEMEMWTTEPGVQFFAGHNIATEVPGLGGRRYGAHAGFCLEAQVWPDSPNRPYFPQAVLVPGETYRHITEYRFRTG